MIRSIALVVFLAATPAFAQDSTWVDHLRAARAAMARDDLDVARAHLERVDALVGGHAGAMANLAVIAAVQGNRERMLHWLDAYAATGLQRHFTRDSTFARFARDTAFWNVAQRIEANGDPIVRATVAITLNDPSLLAEDVAWDARRNRFLVSSIHRGKILAIDLKGNIKDFVTPWGAWGMYALGIDAKRNRLWATTAAGPEYQGYQVADSGRTALLGFELGSGRQFTRVELPAGSSRHVLGDLTIGPDGAVYVSESIGGGVYKLKPGAKELYPIAPNGTFGSPQSPVVSAEGRTLYVADYPRGIATIALRGEAIGWLAKPHDLAAGGIDGLYRTPTGFIAIQNGTNPHRVIALTLDKSGRAISTWRVLEQASPSLGEPDHGALVGRDFYFIGNSGWDRVDAAGILQTTADAKPPVLLRLRL